MAPLQKPAKAPGQNPGAAASAQQQGEIAHHAQPGEFDHMLRPGTTALQARTHAQRGQRNPQIRGHRLLPHQDRDRAVLHIPLQTINLVTGGDHTLRLRKIRIQQSARGPAHRIN